MSGAAIQKKLRNVRLVAFDVDGVFTDGRFYLSNDGIESKSFCTQDGYGIRQLLGGDIEVAVISGRHSAAVEQRMAELGVTHVILACGNKVSAFDDLITSLGIGAPDCAYVGDDIPDLELLQKVGCSIAVANAVAAVRDACDYTTSAGGGNGAVREVCDLVLGARRDNVS